MMHSFEFSSLFSILRAHTHANHLGVAITLRGGPLFTDQDFDADSVFYTARPTEAFTFPYDEPSFVAVVSDLLAENPSVSEPNTPICLYLLLEYLISETLERYKRGSQVSRLNRLIYD